MTGLAELQDSAYAALQPVQWPVPKAGQSGGRYFANGGFSHPDGKARMLPITTPAVQPIPGQFRLNTDRIRDQWHTMTRTGKSPRLSQHLAEPYVEIHPTDAKRLGVGLAELVELRLPKGAGIYRAKISDSVQPGQLFAPMHWTRQNSTESWINAAVAAETDPVSGQPASNGGTVKAQKFEAAWYGYLVSTNKPQLMARYTALSKTHAGWQAEIADNERVEDWEAVLREMTGTEAGDISFFEDRSSGQARLAIVTQNQIQALLFVGPEPVSVARSFAASLIGTETTPLCAVAGRAKGDVPDCGAIVCSCLSVGANTIREAIDASATSVELLGEVTGAGTCCGSCKPELAAMLAQAQSPLAAQ